MTSLTDVVLYTPDMWNNVFSSRRLDSEKLKARWRDMTGGMLEVRKFDVRQSGLRTKAYERVESERAGKSHLPVIVLPIGHCAENIEAQGLKIIGPAIATRNDIFVFRSKKEPPPGSDAAKKKSTFIVGVREAELTTSNISRVVFRHAKPDTFFPPQGSPDKWVGTDHYRFKEVRHAEAGEPRQRALALINGKVHAAIFMGRELDMLGEFANDLIDAANLNRLANNLYNVRLFPRALYVTFEKYIDDARALETAEAFAAAINHEVQAYRASTRERNGKAIERRTQLPSLTGPQAEFDEITTVMRFTMHMLHETFDTDREGSREQRARHLESADFLFYEDVAARPIYQSLFSDLRRIDIAATFACRTKSERADKLATDLEALCSRLEALSPCRRDQFRERVKTTADELRWTRDDAQALLAAVDALIGDSRRTA